MAGINCTKQADILNRTRVLLHPYLSEQPFTRSLTGVKIPPAISQVTIRAHDKAHGYGGAEVKVRLHGK